MEADRMSEISGKTVRIVKPCGTGVGSCDVNLHDYMRGFIVVGQRFSSKL